MNKLAALLAFPLALPLAAAASPPSLQPRQEFCGTDVFGIDWYCTDVGTECCNGSVQGTCIPAGYTCCDTGMFCAPDEDCVIDLSTNTQYCVGAFDDSEETRVADSDGASSTSPPSTDDDDDGGIDISSDDDDDDDDSDSGSPGNDDQEDAAVRGSFSGAGMALVVVVAVGMLL